MEENEKCLHGGFCRRGNHRQSSGETARVGAVNKSSPPIRSSQTEISALDSRYRSGKEALCFIFGRPFTKNQTPEDPGGVKEVALWRRLITWISGTTVRRSAQEPAKAVSGAGDTTGLGRVKLLRSQLGMSFSSCRMTMVSMTKKRPHGNHSVCSWVMNGARSKCSATAMPPLVTKSKLEAGESERRGGIGKEETGTCEFEKKCCEKKNNNVN